MAAVPADGASLLDLRAVSTWLPAGSSFVRAVDGVTLAVKKGQTIGVVGESGSGKSMLARSILNLLPPQALCASGVVVFDGRDLRLLPASKLRRLWGPEMAMVFQDPLTSLNPVVRIGRQFTEVLRTHLGKEEVRDGHDKAAVNLLQRVGIGDAKRRMRQYPHELSGGMRQRVNIAIAISCSPRLLIADEPTTALDVTVQRQILDLLSDLQQARGMAMILVTHDLGVVANRTDRVVVMYRGRIVEEGPTELVFRAPRHPYTAGLLATIPRVEQPAHTRLSVIPGRPKPASGPMNECRFATRCRQAQPACLEQDPDLVEAPGEGRSVACFFPVGSSAGHDALERNEASGVTATGMALVGNGG